MFRHKVTSASNYYTERYTSGTDFSTRYLVFDIGPELSRLPVEFTRVRVNDVTKCDPGLTGNLKPL